MTPVADFFHIDNLGEALRKCIGKEEDLKEALENVLENIQGEISSCSDKLKDIRSERTNVATNLEDIWRIKCKLSNLVTATKTQRY